MAKDKIAASLAVLGNNEKTRSETELEHSPVSTNSDGLVRNQSQSRSSLRRYEARTGRFKVQSKTCESGNPLFSGATQSADESLPSKSQNESSIKPASVPVQNEVVHLVRLTNTPNQCRAVCNTNIARKASKSSIPLPTKSHDILELDPKLQLRSSQSKRFILGPSKSLSFDHRCNWK